MDEVEGARRRVGSLLRGKYRLDALLGVGGMAAVYAATHTNGRRYAVKILHPYLAVDAKAVRRFRNEGYASNRIGHRGAVQIFDDDSDGDCAFLVMELLDGESLSEKLEFAGGALAPGAVLAVMDPLLDVVAAAHDQGILHRDIKPENILVTETGEVKLLDFGTARLRELASSTLHTEPHAFMGTVAYMAPEQARGRQDLIDARTDIWAVGATMFRLLTGRFVHEAATASERLGLTMTVPPRSLGDVAPNLPRRLVATIDRALQFEPDHRWPNARTMQQALQLVASTTSADATVASMPDAPTGPDVAGPVPTAPDSVATLSPSATTLAKPRVTRRAVLVAAGVGVLLVSVLAAWLLARAAPPQTQTAAGASPIPTLQGPASEVGGTLVNASTTSADVPAAGEAAHEVTPQAFTRDGESGDRGAGPKSGSKQQLAPASHQRRTQRATSSRPAARPADPEMPPVQSKPAADPLDRRF